MAKITIEIEVKPEEINDFMCAALEGGINYWCKKTIMKKDKVGGGFEGVSLEDEEKIVYASELISLGGTLILYDAETSDKWELNLEKFLNGLKKYLEIYNVSYESLYENHDADTADCIIQFALFDEIVFG